MDYHSAPAVTTCNAAFSWKVNVLMLLCGCNYWQENTQLILWLFLSVIHRCTIPSLNVRFTWLPPPPQLPPAATATSSACWHSCATLLSSEAAPAFGFQTDFLPLDVVAEQPHAQFTPSVLFGCSPLCQYSALLRLVKLCSYSVCVRICHFLTFSPLAAQF